MSMHRDCMSSRTMNHCGLPCFGWPLEFTHDNADVHVAAKMAWNTKGHRPERDWEIVYFRPVWQIVSVNPSMP
ncbi:hypothetical protein CCMA1212_004108 [Trichoderma ghanense]|uniref:Uncharacterized protein n=1 Tax=Trichoderma ghanense TaxID=65468 RepID=A0ABY2HBG8_9HYPO